MDVSGACCDSGALDAGGSCCRSANIDECGVCDGDGTSCLIAFTLTLNATAAVPTTRLSYEVQLAVAHALGIPLLNLRTASTLLNINGGPRCVGR